MDFWTHPRFLNSQPYKLADPESKEWVSGDVFGVTVQLELRLQSLVICDFESRCDLDR